jgi:hypothetical protein
MRTPLSRAEAEHSVRLLADEVAPHWLRLVSMGNALVAVFRVGGEGGGSGGGEYDTAAAAAAAATSTVPPSTLPNLSPPPSAQDAKDDDDNKNVSDENTTPRKRLGKARTTQTTLPFVRHDHPHHPAPLPADAGKSVGNAAGIGLAVLEIVRQMLMS